MGEGPIVVEGMFNVLIVNKNCMTTDRSCTANSGCQPNQAPALRVSTGRQRSASQPSEWDKVMKNGSLMADRPPTTKMPITDEQQPNALKINV